MRRRSLLTSGLGCAAALALVACGGSDGDGSEPEAGFEAEASAICTAAAREQVEIALRHRSSDLAEVEDQMGELTESADATAAELEALSPPDEDAGSWARYVENRRESAEVVAERGDAAGEGDRARSDDAAAELERLLAERDEIGAELGIDACARILSEADAAEVTDAVELGASSADGEMVCAEVISASYLEQQFGGDAMLCARSQERSQLAEAIEVDSLVGIDGVAATAEVTLQGGPDNGGSARVDLVYEDGAYRILAVGPVPRVPSPG